MTFHKHGGNALGLQRELNLGSYHTAWEWFHKLRQAMIRPDRDLLGGLVEIDETYLGGAKPGKAGRGAEGKALIAVAVEDKGLEGFGRIRMQRIPNASGESLTGFIAGHIVPGGEIRTDGWSGYNQLVCHGYTHLVVNSKKLKEVGEDALPLCHRVISLFKRASAGIFQGAIHFDHLDRYLEEFTFRFNRRTAKHRTLFVFRLLQNAVACPPLPAKGKRQL
jgi:transposase-like protein